jgi:hypothetical protein
MSQKQADAVVRSVVAAAKQGMHKLTKAGYGFINLASGFIAHYNIHGFRDYYERNDFRADILRFQNQNQWHNFHPGEQNYEYMMQKKEIYNRICEAIA